MNHTERAALCPNGHNHTRCPPGYLPWHAWAEEKGKTHVSTRCEGCGLFSIWVPFAEGETAFSARLRPDRTLIRQWRQGYHETVCEHIGAGAVDMAISCPGAFYILKVLGERIVEHTPESRVPGTVYDDALQVLDMGTGFSTMFIREWAIGADICESLVYTGRDHNPDWLAFIERTFVKDDPEYASSGLTVPDNFHLGLIDRSEQGPLCQWSCYDVIIVDHGPQLQTRADDVPWLVTQLKPGGVMLFDDWRPKHEGRIRRALAAVGGDWTIGMGQDTKRWPGDKGIGFATRKVATR